MQKVEISYYTKYDNENVTSLLLSPTSKKASSDSSTLSIVQASSVNLADYRLECPIGYTPKQTIEYENDTAMFRVSKLYCEACLYRHQYLDKKGVFQQSLRGTSVKSTNLENQCKPCPKGADCKFVEIKS